MQFSRSTIALLILPTSVLLIVAALLIFGVPYQLSRGEAKIMLISILVSLFFSFTGVASASNTMKLHPESRTLHNTLLTWYGFAPFFLIGSAILFAMGAAALNIITAST